MNPILDSLISVRRLSSPLKSVRLAAGLAVFAAAAQGQDTLKPDATPAPAAAAASYHNPVIPGDYPDPTVIRVGDTYYSAGTSSEWAPQYPLFTSKDLINWEPIGHVFDKQPEWTVSSFWAPELFYQNKTFYLYYTARRKSDNISVIGVATSDDPKKGFTDRGIICEWGKEAIDGFVFRDNDGKLYFSWKAYGLDSDKRPVAIMASEMTEDALHLKGEAFELLQTDGKPISAEGQVMTRRGDWYYLIYSTRGCCGRDCDYQLEASRAKSLKGPWEPCPYNPILTAGGDWKCPGHGTMVTLPDGRDYFLYHAYSSKDTVYVGRQGMLGEVAWSQDGWPFFATGNTPAGAATVPFPGTTQPEMPANWHDEFAKSTLDSRWQWDIQRPPAIDLSGGKLRLGVSASSAQPSAAGTFVGLRNQTADYVFTASMDTKSPAAKGIAIYGDSRSAVALRQEGEELVLWKIEKGHAEKLTTAAKPHGEEIVLRVDVREGHRLNFSATGDGRNWQTVGDADIDTAYLPPWDRAPRVGIVVAGNPGDAATFNSVELRYYNKRFIQDHTR